MTHYDLIIIGGGSAGLPAGIYASRYKISNLIIADLPGGALTLSHDVRNYPGFEEVSGRDLMDRFLAHAQVSGSEFLQDRVSSVAKIGDAFQVKTLSGKEFSATAILIAMGNKYRKLSVPGEEKLIGSGVSYCATCDGNFFRGREVAMVGGGDAAAVEALYLSELCSKVHLLVRRDVFRAEKVWVDKLLATPNIEVHFNTQVAEIRGSMFVEDVLLQGGSTLAVDGVFVAVGNDPDSSLFDDFLLEKDDEGYLRVNARQETSFPGIFAAGDITTNSNKFKQTIMSAAE